MKNKKRSNLLYNLLLTLLLFISLNLIVEYKNYVRASDVEEYKQSTGKTKIYLRIKPGINKFGKVELEKPSQQRNTLMDYFKEIIDNIKQIFQ